MQAGYLVIQLSNCFWSWRLLTQWSPSWKATRCTCKVLGPGKSSCIWTSWQEESLAIDLSGGDLEEPHCEELTPQKKERSRNEILMWEQWGIFWIGEEVTSGPTLLISIKLSVNSDHSHFPLGHLHLMTEIIIYFREMLFQAAQNIDISL